jgi:hypothetical protein
MLDFDLAALYRVETRALKQTVRRNVERFPGDFMFQLSKHEWDEVITICDNLPGNVKYSPATPFAFTQEGVAMLSGVLRSPVAIRVNIEIMRAFVAMRHYISSTATLTAELAELRASIELLRREGEDTLKAVNDLSEDTRKHIDNLYNAIGALSLKPPRLEQPRRRIGFNQSDE